MQKIGYFKKYFNIELSLNTLLGLLFLGCLAVYIRLAIILFNGPEFCDETEKLVGTLMIFRGGHLYRDIFSHHGPLTFMLAQGFHAITGSTNIGLYRTIPLLFSLVSITAVFFSPILQTLRGRLIGSILMIIGLSANLTIFGLMMGLYQVYAGHLIVCALALFVLPVLLNYPVNRLSAFMGGFAIGLIFFAAYSFILSCFFLLSVCIYKALFSSPNNANVAWEWGKSAIAGIFAVVLIVFTWLLIYGDLLGYIVYHLYFNQFVYKNFSTIYESTTICTLLILIIPLLNYFYLTYVSHFLSYTQAWIPCVPFFCVFFYTVMMGCLKFPKPNPKQFRISLLLLCLGLMLCDPRGSVRFQSNTIAIVGIGFMALITAYITTNKFYYSQSKVKKMTSIATVLVLFCFIAEQFFAKTNLFDLDPIAYYGATNSDLGRSQDPSMQLIRSFLGPNDVIESLPISLLFYINLDRSPASGNYYYLPWQDAYFKKPILGYKIDICRDIKKTMPKAFLFDTQLYPWGLDNSYLDCVHNILKRHYVRSEIIKNLWIRVDVIVKRDDLLNTAIIPDSFDVSSLSSYAQQRINSKKIVFKKLQSTYDKQCVLGSKLERGIIRTGDCNDKNALKLGLYQTKDRGELRILPHYECVEVTGASMQSQATLRAWPCMPSAINQSFDLISSAVGFKLRVKHSNLCLTTGANNRLVQDKCSIAKTWGWY